MVMEGFSDNSVDIWKPVGKRSKPDYMPDTFVLHTNLSRTLPALVPCK